MSDVANKHDIAAVRRFWDENPLWVGEGMFEPGSRAFFEEHRRVYYDDCFAGKLDERVFSRIDQDAQILDLGCGPGFWLVEFWRRGFHNLVGADLSPRSLEVASLRCEIYGTRAKLLVQNAEKLEFEDQCFDHVNCQGVIHHTPNPSAAISEIFRVLRPGGTASLSVYYRNVLLRNWHAIRPLSNLLARLGGGMKGRGREDMMVVDSVDEIVRRYDGIENPIGVAFDARMFRNILEPKFCVEEIFFHFFPARAMPFAVPGFAHRFLDRYCPFMIYANVRRQT